ncbi:MULTISPECIES: nicotinate (nicotinamide) nucleotide adenylyltransferase [Bacillota]|uniref:Probable nicotinate-nucleotide adenylyltransferase n=2 Tax=Amedibacillus TaxID=2749846 RepID=A0A7G9GLJ1_9FIRM|nr:MULTISPECIES: nicotinate (nicotinamide) nucleotide adenylyltransferase [Bacillota]QNM11673.1 nicotinate (nicotinamide) nucleotide adenylyltransferase [[Eubacterium] hominis]MCH4285078.1 nicotinate (nicotinamide) nucleotide adenylyltransferase [Amedibacillus hominis]RGB56107.1 nicotinate (nicotinamide) nucleotide adenylyltransferase [Absiella sp. AM22-9]RGB61868.1 nicotinate (nicotinamide) nucleotide adenylyltransferase [Absiella sp. AM10-20]RGB70309.1 nicotinate (nicotinamide) nucleotide ad
MRIAVLGGSFDPIHKGHIQIAKMALKKMRIDQVWFMPAKDAPLKDHQSVSFYDRCQMVRCAIRPYRHMKLCTLEGERSEKSYTIDTVKELKRRYPNDEFCWLIGDDQAKQFSAWKDHEQLLKEIDFYVFSREKDMELDERFHRVTMPLIDVSSSQIREGKKLYQLCKSVRIYMAKHGLYFDLITAAHMSEKRYRHSLSVADLCVELARAHGLDEKKAYTAGLIHDVCKQMPVDQQRIWMKYHLPQFLDEASAIWHGYIGAYYAKHTLYVTDKDVIHSIYHHVKGRNINDYERILFIADKLDPSRGYDSSKEIKISKQNLKKGYEVVKQQQQEYLKKEGSIA